MVFSAVFILYLGQHRQKSLVESESAMPFVPPVQKKEQSALPVSEPVIDFQFSGDSDRFDEQGDLLPAEAMWRFGTVRLRHGGQVSSMVFTPDGNHLLTTGIDRTLSWWDSSSGAEIKRINVAGYLSRLWRMPDNCSFMHYDHNRQIFARRDLTDGKILNRFIGESDYNLAILAASDNGRWLAAGSAGNYINIWNVDSGDHVARLVPPVGTYTRLFFAADSKILTALSETGKYRSWATEDWQVESEGTTEIRWEYWCEISGRTMVTVFKGIVNVFNLEGFRLLNRFPIGSGPIAVSADGKTVASMMSGIVRVFRVVDGLKIFSTLEPDYKINALSLSDDGSRLATGDYNGRIQIFRTNLKAEADGLPGESGDSDNLASGNLSQGGLINSLGFSPDGRRLISAYRGGTIAFWDLESGREFKTIAVGSEPMLIRPLPEDRLLVMFPGRYQLMDLTTGEILSSQGRPFDAGYPCVFPVAASHDGARVAIITSSFRPNSVSEIQVWEVATNRQIGCFDHPGDLGGIALSADGRRLAMTTRGKTQRLLGYRVDESRLDVDIMIPTKMSYISAPVFWPDGRLMIAGGSYEKRAEVVKEKDGNWGILFADCLGLFEKQMAISADGKALARPNWMNRDMVQTTRLPWGDSPVRSFSGHRGRVTAATFSPGGRYLATGGDDGTILLWDLHRAEAGGIEKTGLAEQETAPAELPIFSVPVLSLDFEGEISAEKIGRNFIATGSSAHAFEAGIDGRCLALSSIDRRLIEADVEPPIALESGWTLQFWFKSRALPEDDRMPSYEFFDSDLVALRFNSNRQIILFYRFANRGGHGSTKLFSQQRFESDNWYHFAASWPGGSGQLKVFIDGQQVWNSGSQKLADKMGKLSFGQHWSAGVGRRFMIDRFRLHNYALSHEEIRKFATPDAF
ncbi:MAG: LamG-like jellyroll fold domain-containing protein [Candidatus Rifleibacteriota bacterium]